MCAEENIEKELYMKIFGLTGNMGSGKSTVASLLVKYPDVKILDCDAIGKKIISGMEHEKEICDILGKNVYTGGFVDFKQIAEIIFNDPGKRVAFETLLYPPILGAVDKLCIPQTGVEIFVVESAILYEIEWENRFAAVIVAACDHDEQVRRLVEIRKVDPSQIEARLALQMPSSQKEAAAQFVINTGCGMSELKNRVADLYLKLKSFQGT